MFKRIFSIIISLLMLFSAISAEELSENTFPIYENIASDEVCSFLVELEGGGVLERRQNGSMPLNGYEKSRSYTELENIQTSALKSVSKVTDTVPKGQLTHIMNGIIVDGSNTDLEQLKSLPNVKAVHILPNLYTIEPVSSIPAIETNAAISDFDKLQTEPIKLDSVKNQYTGDGMVIGIIDSELWYDHPVFQTEPQNPKLSIDDISNLLNTNNFIAESKINTAEKVLTANDVYINSKIPFAFDYANNDCNPKSDNEDRYHGTHVAGIAAASSEDYSGIARDAQIVFAKVAFDNAPKGSINTASTLLALDDMVKLDVDVINMSLGIAAGFSDGGGIFNNIFKTLENSGICVVASAGNEGSFGNDLKTTAPLASAPDYGLIGQPASCVYSTAVASCASSVMFHKFTLYNGTTVSYQDSSFLHCDTNFDTLINNRTVPYVYCGMGTESDFESIEDLTDSIAVISRGGAAFSDSIGRAETRGAIAAIIINTTNSYILIDVPDRKIPVITVPNLYSDSIINAVIKELTVNKKSNLLSDFSSRGATPDLKLKPEITAVGACVYSAAYYNSFATADGTSQAAPQYAGSCAVVLDYVETDINPDMSKAASHILASQLLASGAVPWTIDGLPDSTPASPRIQGAGVINLEASTTSPSVLYNTYNGKTKVELGQLSGNNFSFDFIVQNFSDHSVTYNLTADVITDDYKTTIIDGQTVNIVDGSRFLKTARTTFNCGSSITVAAHHDEVITATVTVEDRELSALKEIFENGLFIEGYVKLTANSLPEISIPFMGFHGDWCNLSAFDNASYGLANTLYVKSNSHISPLINDNGTWHYSPNLGVFLARIQNVRNLSRLSLIIKDENGKIVYDQRYVYVPKMYVPTAYADFEPFKGIDTFTNKELSDGKYTAIIYGIPVCTEGHNHKPQEQIFRIYIDRTTPQMINAYIDKNDTIDGIKGLWLKVSATDSPQSALKQYELIDPTQNKIPYRYLPETNEYAFNITGYSLPSCKIKLSDAAQNTSTYNITRANGYAKSFSDGKCTDIVSFNALLTNGLILNRFDHNANTDGTQKSLYAFDKNLKPLTQPYDVTEN